jgi:hypothetical protein
VIKSIYLARRNPSTSFEEFMDNWAAHAVLSGSFPDVLRSFNGVVQVKRVVGLEHPRLSAEYDGANILTLTSLQDAVDIHDRDGIETLRADEMRVFADYVVDTSLTVHGDVVRDQPVGQVVLLDFAAPAPDQDRIDFVKAWGRFSRNLMADPSFPGAGRVCHNHVVMPPPPGYEYGVVNETWFDAADDAVAFVDATAGLYDDAGIEFGPRIVLDRNHVWFRRT